MEYLPMCLKRSRPICKSEDVRLDVLTLVREMGLEPTRRNHTHLKRACLPFQHSRKCLIIIMQEDRFVNCFFCAGETKIPENFILEMQKPVDK